MDTSLWNMSPKGLCIKKLAFSCWHCSRRFWNFRIQDVTGWRDHWGVSFPLIFIFPCLYLPSLLCPEVTNWSYSSCHSVLLLIFFLKKTSSRTVGWNFWNHEEGHPLPYTLCTRDLSQWYDDIHHTYSKSSALSSCNRAGLGQNVYLTSSVWLSLPTRKVNYWSHGPPYNHIPTQYSKRVGLCGAPFL